MLTFGAAATDFTGQYEATLVNMNPLGMCALAAVMLLRCTLRYVVSAGLH